MVRFRADVSRPDTSPNRHSAFTLIEIMVALALFGIVMATVGPNMKSSSVSTKGAALALAAALTEARQQAITQQVPVALVIPSASGTQGQANSYYIAAGEQPRVTQVKRLGGDQSDLRLMVGHWPLDTSKLKDSTLTTTIDPPPEATWENDFDLNLWGLPAPKDYAFIFTPRGKLLTNDLPHFDGAYHLVVSHGGRSTLASVPGTGVMATPPNLHGLTQVGTPYTVTVDPAGAVSVTPGLMAVTTSGVEIKDQAALTAPPDLPNLSAPPNSVPVVTSVTLLPDPAKLDPPTGVDVLLTPDRHMTMTVRAKSPDQIPLFCQWKATDGGLSSPEQVQATFLPQAQEWESVWQWRFPADAEPGDQFTLEGVVKDAYGNEAPVGLGAGADPFVVQAGDPTTRMVFSTQRDGVGQIYSLNTDGTGLKRLADQPRWGDDPKWSPDGERVVFMYEPASGKKAIYLVNSDGTGLTALTLPGSVGGGSSDPVWSPDGTKIAFNSTRDGNSEVYVMNADGSGQTNITNNPKIDGYPVWSPDGSRIAYRHYPDGVYSDVWVVNADGSGPRVNVSNFAGRSDYFPTWSPDGSRIAFQSETEVYSAKPDGTGKANLTSQWGADGSPAWSPSGNKIAYWRCNGGSNDYYEIFSMNADGTGKANLTNTFLVDCWPQWTPDGKHIAFRSVRDGNWELYIMNPDGTNQVNLTNHAASDGTFHLR
jgi:prepilin-type N-terminal cleavage/methylation domain-containing protein